MVYHLLPDLEQFCPVRGGALSKIVANWMCFDHAARVVACSASVGAWGHEPDRIVVIPELLTYSKIKGRRFIPQWIRGPFFRHIFHPLVSRLERGDIVWLHNQPYIAAALGRSIRLAGAKLIYHAHDPYVPHTAQTVFKSFASDAWVFGSEALRQKYLRLFPQWKNTYILHNGADERLFYPPASATRNNAVAVILYVGRLQAEKGVHILVDAVRILQKRKVAVLCKLVGSHFSGGSRATSYVRSLKRSSPSNVEFAGYRAQTEVAQEFRSADIFCCPSIWLEAFGCVNVEAMASGIPVVATRVGGIPEIAAEGGILLIERESAVELADALQKLIEDRDLRAKVGAEGLASFRRRFTWTAIARQYREIVERTL